MRACLRASRGRPGALRPLSQIVRRPLDHDPGFRPDRGRITGRLWVLSAGLCMSLGGPIIRLADESTPWQFLFYRSLGAAAMILLYFLITRRPVLEMVRSAGVNGLVGGLGLAVAFTGYVWGVMHSTVANALFLISAAPLVAAFLGWMVLREPVARSMWFAMFGVIAGVAIMIGEGLAEADLLGDLAALASAVGFAASRSRSGAAVTPTCRRPF